MPRHAAPLASAYLDTFRVVQITGPRQSGKSTLAREISRESRIEVSFDDSAVRVRAEADPYGFLLALGEQPVLIDEVQRVPDIYLAIKRVVDKRANRGQYLLTGSSDPLTNREVLDSLAGRIGVVDLRPFSQAERRRSPSAFLDQLFAAAPAWDIAREEGVSSYLQRMRAGGFPEVVDLPEHAQARWFESFVQSTFARDVRDIVGVEDLGRLRRLFDIIASHSGQLFKAASLARDAELSANTARAWIDALAQTRLVDAVPAWSGGRRSRLVASPRLYVADSGLLLGVLGAADDGVLRDPMLLGNLVETFVVQDVLRQLTARDPGVRPRAYHYRDRDQREVDLVLEHPDGRVVAIEIKSATRVNAADASGIRAFRTAAGAKFHRGVVLYAGQLPFALESDIAAVPMAALWANLQPVP